MNEKNIFTESENEELTKAAKKLQEDLTIHNKACLFDEQNNFFVGFGYDGIQGFIDQCNQGKITVSTTINKLKDVNLELEKEIERLKKIERKFQHQNENFQFMGFDGVSDFLHQWIDNDKITVIQDNPQYDLVEEINKLRAGNFELKNKCKKLENDSIRLEKIETEFNGQNKFFEGFGYKDTQGFINQCNHGKIMVMTLEQFKTYSNFENEINRIKNQNFDLEKIETQFNLQNEKFQLMGFDDANDFLDQWLEDHKIEIVIDPDTFSHNNVNKYKAENVELKQQIKNLKAENVDLLSQINNLTARNKQLCKDADTFLKKKDPASKMYQDLEFIKNLINTLQKEYNKSESKNGIID